MEYPTELEFVRARHGRNWCVAARMTDRLRAKGYEVVLTPKRYAALCDEWRDGHPLVNYVRELPDSPLKPALFIAACEFVDSGRAHLI